KLLRFFAGVPLTNGPISVGAICLVDEKPRRFGADGFSLLEALGRRSSAVLSAHEAESGPLWTPSGLVSRDGLLVLLTAEVLRLAREPISLGLFVFSGHAPAARIGEHSAIAELGEGRLAALFARDNHTEARQALLELVGEVVRADDFGGGGLVTIEPGAGSS